MRKRYSSYVLSRSGCSEVEFHHTVLKITEHSGPNTESSVVRVHWLVKGREACIFISAKANSVPALTLMLGHTYAISLTIKWQSSWRHDGGRERVGRRERERERERKRARKE